MCAIQQISTQERCKIHLENLGWHLPLGKKEKVEFLNARDPDFLSKRFSEEELGDLMPSENVGDATFGIRRMIIAREGVTQEEKDRIQAYKEAIRKDYEGTVLRSAVFPDPPERERMGMRIAL